MTSLLLALTIAAPPTDDSLYFLLGSKKPDTKHIVLISGDEEYRSEEALSQLAMILNKHHGFMCTVLFAVDPDDGCVQPNKSNIPGLEALKSADLMIIATRYRHLPDEQTQHIVDYLSRGKPVIGLRTATHGFNGLKTDKFAWLNSSHKEGGFGRQVLGENWVAHHGQHGKQGTRGRLAREHSSHPVLRGIGDGEIFGPSDVYAANPVTSTPLLLGEVTDSLKPDSKAIEGKKNEPLMPIAWTRKYKEAKVFATTMGCSQDLENEAFRRLLVNAVYWAVDWDPPAKAAVELVGEYKPSPFKFKKDAEWKPGKKVADYFPGLMNGTRSYGEGIKP